MDTTATLMKTLLVLHEQGKLEVTTTHLAQAAGVGADDVCYYLKHHADMGRVGCRHMKGHRHGRHINLWRLLRTGEEYLAKKLERQNP